MRRPVPPAHPKRRCRPDPIQEPSRLAALLEAAERGGAWMPFFDALARKLRMDCREAGQGMDTPEGLAMLEEHVAALAGRSLGDAPETDAAAIVVAGAIRRGAKAGAVEFCTDAMALCLQLAGFEALVPAALDALASQWERRARKPDEAVEEAHRHGRR